MPQPTDTKPIIFEDEDEYRPEPAAPPEPPAWRAPGASSTRIGIHTSIAGDLTQSLETAHALGANAVQIFSASPRMWPAAAGSASPAPKLRGTRIPEAEAARFRQRREELKLGPLVVHDNYLINLASPERVLRVRSIQTFRDEVIRAMTLGADYLVAHPGAGRGAAGATALETVADALRQALRGLRLGEMRVLLENTAGQGTAVGARFEELRAILSACGPALAENLGVCVDTAHLFAAGYPIHTAEGLERTLQAIEATVGLNRIFVVHVNDSKAGFGSRVDRHEHIGKGKIGLEAFRRILNHPLLAGRAFILETPIDRPGDDARNVRTLWGLVGVKPVQVAGASNGFRIRKKKRAPQRTRRTQRKKRT